jgi:TolB-like protein
MLAERFRESAVDRAAQNSLVVLPFTNLGATEVAPLYGFALADAIAARLARIPALVIRPSSTLMQLPIARWTRLQVGQKLLVSFVLAGNFLRSDEGIRSQLATARRCTQSVRSGGAIRVASLDLIAVQTEISNEVFAALHGLSAGDQMDPPRARNGSRECDGSLPGPVSEEISAGARVAQLVHGAHRLPRRSRSRSHAVHQRHLPIPSLPPAGAAWASLSCSMCATASADRST